MFKRAKRTIQEQRKMAPRGSVVVGRSGSLHDVLVLHQQSSLDLCD